VIVYPGLSKKVPKADPYSPGQCSKWQFPAVPDSSVSTQRFEDDKTERWWGTALKRITPAPDKCRGDD
ncbi:MAG: hypothetical protein AAFR99_19430, partial [Cyanobacteria bacterium J06629_9]